MSTTTQDLLNLKKRIETAKQELSEHKGRENALREKLKEDFDCTYEEADEKLEEMREELKDLKAQRDDVVEELEEEFEL